jgi:hypothetical protein
VKNGDLNECLEIVRQAGVFTVGLVSRHHAYFEPDQKLPAHRNVLLPLLRVAEECWVYDVRKSSKAFRLASEILTPSKGKYRIDISGDPVTTRERFWNVHSGERGTIVIVVPLKLLNAKRIFSACYGAWVFGNFLAGHTPAAARFARARAASGEFVSLCLPRNNGIEWMDVFARPTDAERLFKTARSCVKRR